MGAGTHKLKGKESCICLVWGACFVLCIPECGLRLTITPVACPPGGYIRALNDDRRGTFLRRRSMVILLQDDLVDSCKAGDDVVSNEGGEGGGQLHT